jgi:hypothetical protein
MALDEMTLPLIMSNMIARLQEVKVSPEDALDELVDLDSDTVLGRAMTEIMAMVANYKLLDYYIGYDRVGPVVSMYLNKEAKPENLQKLVSEIESKIETGAPSGEETSFPVIRAELYRSDATSEDFTWVLKLTVLFEEPDLARTRTPVHTAVSGDIEVKGEKDEVEFPLEIEQ